jgi:hypothetical protein
MKCREFVNKKEILVYECEEEKIAKIKKEKFDYLVDGFLILNPKKEKIEFIAVDNCLDKSNEKKCDFAFVKNSYYLVELKLDTKPKNRTKRLDYAIKQLQSSIDYFKDKKIKECFVCFGKSVVVKTAWKNKEYRFFELTKIPLHISCKKELND